MTAFEPFGLGTYQLEGEQCTESVATALDAGYRHIDTAQSYENEDRVAAGIDQSSVSRDDIFLATKLATGNLAYDDAVETARESADTLGVECIDLLYVHWPLNSYDATETCRALNDLHEDGVIDRVGLSNFRPDQLDTATDLLDVPLFAHQVECHPLLPQDELREYAVEDDHWLVAYCPIARNQVADVPEMVEVAERHDATPAQVSIAWLRSKENVAAIPKATSESHIRENLAATELELDAEDVATIDAIEDRNRIVAFDDAPWNQAPADD
jgi:diketogulonate reductase-like aldo/keto reductase